jgi:hypothetical protein
MNYFLLAPQEGGHPTIPSQSVKPLFQTQNRRAHECAAGVRWNGMKAK